MGDQQPIKYALISLSLAIVMVLVVGTFVMLMVNTFILIPIFEENSFTVLMITWPILLISWGAYVFNAHIREKDVNDYCVYLNTSGARRDKDGKKISYIDPVCPDCHGSGKRKNGRFFLTTCDCISRNANAEMKRNRIKRKNNSARMH